MSFLDQSASCGPETGVSSGRSMPGFDFVIETAASFNSMKRLKGAVFNFSCCKVLLWSIYTNHAKALREHRDD
jgi:hypothetical protein